MVDQWMEHPTNQAILYKRRLARSIQFINNSHIIYPFFLHVREKDLQIIDFVCVVTTPILLWCKCSRRDDDDDDNVIFGRPWRWVKVLLMLPLLLLRSTLWSVCRIDCFMVETWLVYDDIWRFVLVAKLSNSDLMPSQQNAHCFQTRHCRS